MGEPAEIIDIATRERIVPPAVAQVVLEDERGKYVMHDGQRIPVRNGGPVAGQTPLEDWQTAREVEQDIERGDGIHAEPFSWHNLFGAVLSVSTSVGGWTTYRTTGEPGAILWACSMVLWLASMPFVATLALRSSVLWIPLWFVALCGWTVFCRSLCESDKSIRRKLARERKDGVILR